MSIETDKLIKVREKLDIFVKGAEIDWAKEYASHGEHFENLLSLMSKLERNVKKYFKQVEPDLIAKVDWAKYEKKLAADSGNDFLVDVNFEDDGFDDIFINFTTTVVTDIQLAGMMSLYATASVQIDTGTLSEAITISAQKYVGKLVTKINETTRDRINQSINDSLELGLTKEDAAQALIDNNIINDPYRAELIAHTESVGAYSRGRQDYAEASGAIGKTWHTQSGKPCEDCQDCEGEGQIDVTDSFGPEGWDTPDDSHPNCYCVLEYVYPEETDTENN